MLETASSGSWQPLFDSLDELTTAIDTALDQILPKVSNYF
jgi:hypothetical protein